MALEIDVRDLVGRPGSSRPVHVEEPVAGLATGLVRVPEDSAVSADLLLESVVEGILASGRIAGTMSCSCARCLREFERDFEVLVQELFSRRDAGAGDVSTGGEDEYPLGEDGFVDVEPMLRDAILLAMPFAPLHAEDCLGLCERCGGDRNVGECTCGPADDPRWAALADLVLPERADGARATDR